MLLYIYIYVGIPPLGGWSYSVIPDLVAIRARYRSSGRGPIGFGSRLYFARDVIVVAPMRFHVMGSNLPVDLPVPHTSTSQAGTSVEAKGLGTTRCRHYITH